MTTAAIDRLLVMDVTRGLAVMGILLMNIVSFAMPEAAYVNPKVWGWNTPLDGAVWVFNQLVFEGRMRGLFALLFGASILLVMDRAQAAGERPVAVHLRRMVVLALIGSAHLVFVWNGDVLLHYALLGMAVWIVRNHNARVLIGIAVVVLALHTLYWSMISAGALWVEHAAALPGADPATVARAQALATGFPGPANPGIAAEVARMRGDYAGILAHRAQEALVLPYQFLMLMGGETLGYMLLGMGLFRSGFFTGGWSDARLRRLMCTGYAIGVPALAALTAWTFASDFDPILVFAHFAAWPVPFRVLVALAHLSLAVQLIRRFGNATATHRIAAVGRMALSNYLMTSVVMTTIFYGYGLGLFGDFGRAAVNLFVLGMWGAMLLWSKPWLAHFRFGPAEWLWRSLARLRVQPLRSAAT